MTTLSVHKLAVAVDPEVIANNFAHYFAETYSPNSINRAALLHTEYLSLRESYFGYPLADYGTFDTELVSKIIYDLKRGKAPDINGLTVAEHLIQAHPILAVILIKLFRLCVLCKHVPLGFGHSYIVPLSKVKDCTTKSLNCKDFRGIAISPVVSKIFENCLLAKLGDFFSTQNNQFGFKEGLGCNHAIYTVRRVVENFINGGEHS